jgi:hypothetical protein
MAPRVTGPKTNGSQTEVAAVIGEPTAAAVPQPVDMMIPRNGATIAALFEVLQAAFYDASIEPDGDILTREDYRVWVQAPDTNAIRFLSQFSVKPSGDHADRLEYVNAVNGRLRIPRAALFKGTDQWWLIFDHYVYVDGGLPKSSFVAMLRPFHRSLDGAIKLDTKDVLA